MEIKIMESALVLLLASFLAIQFTPKTSPTWLMALEIVGFFGSLIVVITAGFVSIWF